MNRNRVIVAGVVAAILVLAGREILRGPRSTLAGFNRATDAKYQTIRIGAPKAEVLAVLGQPIRTEPVFCLPQRHGFEKLFAAADRSASTEYYLWINGMNWYYCIGFDRNGAVSMKGEGHS